MARVAVLSESPLAFDARVVRHAEALQGDGHEVLLIAPGPLPSQPPSVPLHRVGDRRGRWRIRAGLVLRQAPATLLPASAGLLYWLSARRWRMHRALSAFAPEIVLANDWQTLPVALVQKRRNATVIYDSHELATAEFAGRAGWRLAARAHVAAVESRCIVEADAVMTVSQTLADRLAALYKLSAPPLVVRNRPPAAAERPRRTGDSVAVLYLGLIAPGRCLEELIASVAQWPPQMHLVIQGPDAAGFRARLEALAIALAPGRVAFRDPVSPQRTVEAASQADVGVFFVPVEGQSAVMLPNKIFEYMAAGLAIVSIDLPEIRSAVERTGAGLLIADATPTAIATVLGSLSREAIDRMKMGSLEAWRADAGSDITRFLRLVRTLAPR
jgi:glycosyltransferase involved in cell wall biosynthesis